MYTSLRQHDVVYQHFMKSYQCDLTYQPCHDVTQTLKHCRFIVCLRATTTRRLSRLSARIPIFLRISSTLSAILPGETTSVTSSLLTWMTKPLLLKKKCTHKGENSFL